MLTPQLHPLAPTFSMDARCDIPPMASDTAIDNPSWSSCHSFPRFRPLRNEYPALRRSKCTPCTSTASAKVVAVFAKGECSHPGNKNGISKEFLHSLSETHRVLEVSDRSPSGFPLATGQGKAILLRPSSVLNKLTGLSSESAASLRLISDADTQREDSSFVTCSPTSLTKVLRVAVDVDEVLGSFLASLNVFIAEQHCLSYNISEYSVYDFMKVWQCSQAEANNRVHAFFESEHFKDGISPIPGAYDALVRIADFCHLLVVTSRQHVIQNQTLDWIEKHYSGIFAEVHFGNHFALEGVARPKSEICRSIGAEVLIDDNPRYAVECANHGIEVLLFDYNNSYPWSKTPDGPVHPLITRVQTWHEVEAFLFERSSGRR